MEELGPAAQDLRSRQTRISIHPEPPDPALGAKTEQFRCHGVDRDTPDGLLIRTKLLRPEVEMLSQKGPDFSRLLG